MTKIAVIGAGVIGLSSAYKLKLHNPELDVTVIADKLTPDTCSDGAAGIWEPYIMRGTPMHLQKRWSKSTWDWIAQLIKREDSPEIGLSMCSGYNLHDVKQEIPEWSDLVPDFRVLSEEEMKRFPSKYVCGFFMTVLFLEGQKYLPFLIKSFQELDGKILKRKLTSVDELSGSYDVVINCSGFGARELCGDNRVEPIRGQIMRVKAPWINHFYLNSLQKQNTVTYILPNIHSVVLGGTNQLGNYSEEVSLEDREHIMRETRLLEPSLAKAEYVCDWVGLRPSRDSVRLERENVVTSETENRILRVVHNYGHGGAGMTTHWGCAEDAAALALECIDELERSKNGTAKL